MSHTPTPWYVRTAGLISNGKSYIGNVYATNVNGVMEDNAEFIVKACNRDHLFDEMVKALQAMQKLLDKNMTFLDHEVIIPFESHDQGWNHVHEARDIVKSVLAKIQEAA